MQRAWEPYAGDSALHQATSMFVKLAEHTWGLSQLYNASANCSNPSTEASLKNGSFDFNLHTWDEQRNFTQIAYDLVPAAHPLKPIWREILARQASAPQLEGFVATAERSFSTPLGDASFTTSGAMVLRELQLGKFSYATLGEDVYNITGPDVCCQVLGGKKGSGAFGGATRHATARLVELWRAANGTAAFWARLAITGDGAPASAWSHFVVSGRGHVEVELVVLGKVATRFNEAGWFGFETAPGAAEPGRKEWAMEKLGSQVRFEDVVRGGSPAMHGVDRAIWQGHDGTMVKVESIDAPVLSAVGPRTDPSESLILVNQQETLQPKDVNGVAFNLWNNAWSTNYMFFYPYHHRDADMSFSFAVDFGPR